MKKVLLAFVIASFCWSCAASQSKNIEPNSRSNVTDETPSPTEIPDTKEIVNKMEENQKTPNVSINEADFTAVKLVQNKMEKMTLAKQPQEIVKQILDVNNETSEKPFGRTLDKINLQVEDYDLDHDGIAERVIIARLFSDESPPVIYIFKSENGKWNRPIFEADLGEPDSNTHQEVEFLVNKDKSGFDVIKLVDEFGSVEIPQKTILYFQMKDGKYERIECRNVEGKTGEKISECKE